MTDCDKAFDEWYAMQRHQLTNDQLCRLIWRRGWEGHAKARAQRAPLSRREIELVATYAPEGVTFDEVAEIVAKVELMHGITSNA